MKNFRQLIWGLLAVPLWMCPEAQGTFELIGVSWTGDPVVRIDPATGQATTIGSVGFRYVNSLAQNREGTLYGAGSVGNGDFFTIDPVTGAGTSIGTLTFAGEVAPDVRGMAFSPTDILFAINNGGDPSSTTVTDDLYTIDVATGLATFVGHTGFTRIQGLDVSPNGTLYAWDVGSGLLVIDAANGIASDVNSLTDGNGGIQSIVFGPDGVLYGAGNALYRIDVNSGARTLIGSGGYTEVRGIEVVPEPGAWVVMVAGASLGLLCCYRRHVKENWRR